MIYCKINLQNKKTLPRSGIMQKFQIPTSKQSKQVMVTSFQNALSSAKEGLDLISSFYDNGHGLAKWSFIYENQYTESKTHELYTFQGKRKGWKLVGVVDKSSGYLYFFISKQNLCNRQSQKIKSNKPMYYISAFSGTFNQGFDDILPLEQKLPIQIKMDLSYDYDQAKHIVSEVLRGCDISITRFCLIVADIKKYKLNSVEAIILNEDLEELYIEDWSNFIVVHEPEELVSGSDEEDDQHDLDLPLKMRKAEDA